MLAIAHIPFTHFQIPLEVVVLGAITGLVYALLGVGLVIVYKSSRVLNFAHGEMGVLAAKVLPVLVLAHGMSYWAALPIALAASVGAGALTEVVVIRRLSRAPRLVVLVATIGAAQLFAAGAALLVAGRNFHGSPFPLPFTASVTIGSLRVGAQFLLVLITVPVLTIALAVFFRTTRVGLASRAAAENLDAAELCGVPSRTISVTIWALAGLFAGVSAILVGPSRPIVELGAIALGPGLMVRALAAAMLGGLDKLSTVFFSGVAIGVMEALIVWNYPTGGLLEVALFALILVSLLARRGLGQTSRGGPASSWSLAGRLRSLSPRVSALPRVRMAKGAFLGAAGLVAVLAPLPLTSGQRVLLSSIAVFAIMGLSVVVLTGFAGQISLGQFAFVGIGALVGGRIHQLGYPPWEAMVYAVIAGGVVALLVGLPAFSIRGLFLAVTTLGFAVASQSWLYGQQWLVHVVGRTTSLEIPRPRLLGVDLADEGRYYWFCLLALVVVATLVHNLHRTGLGRSMIAVRDNEPAAATLGVSPRRVKLTAFVLAGMIAGLGGYLYGGLLVQFPTPQTFAPELSLALVAMVILGGVTTVTGAILGALWVRGAGYALAPILPALSPGTLALIVSGPGLLFVLLAFPGGLASIAFRIRDAAVRAVVGAEEPERPSTDGGRNDSEPRRERVPLLAARGNAKQDGEAVLPAIEARGIVVSFGGNHAVDDVSVRAEQGSIIGLVGPNGAGKTTLFDVLSGQLRPHAGHVTMGPHDVTDLRPEHRAQLGLGRTFQQARLFDDLPLIDAFKVALECREPSEAVPSLLTLPPARSAERRKDLRAHELVDLLGLGRFAQTPLAELSTGTRRMAELGCTVALGARVLLLDEPTAGIAQRDVEAFRPVLRELRDHLDATMVVIEHDVPLIVDLVDHVYVLAVGQVIFEGAPHLLRTDENVIRAYLGTDERVIRRSGVGAGA